MEKGEIIKVGSWFLADWGPMRLKIGAWKGGEFLEDLAKNGAYYAFDCLREVSEYLPLLRIKAHKLRLSSYLPPTVVSMIRAAQLVGDQDLTPLCAVAGAIAEAVISHLLVGEADRIIAENGGDIALYMREKERVLIGIRPKVDENAIRFKLEIDGSMGIGGIATSGLGGRSLTKGVADAAVVLAKTGSIADAAATSIANSTFILSSKVRRVRAEDLDINTDLKGEEVTTYVGNLTPFERRLALEKGIRKAEELKRAGLIFGAIIYVQGDMAFTKGIDKLFREFES